MIDFRAHARQAPKRIILCENDERVLRAARTLADEGLCVPVLVGSWEEFNATAKAHGFTLDSIEAIAIEPQRYAQQYHELRKHKNITEDDALRTLADPAYFSCMLLLDGQADGLVCGATWSTANTLRPALQLLRGGHVASYFIMRTTKGDYLFGDCALNVRPNEDELSQIAVSIALEAERLGIEPHIAMLSHSSEGSAHDPDEEKVQHAARAARAKARELGKGWPISDDIQVDAAMDEEIGEHKAPHGMVHGDATVFIFPDIDAGNIGYKLVQRFAGAEAIGPITTNLKRPVNDLSRGCTSEEVVDVCCITAWQAGSTE